MISTPARVLDVFLQAYAISVVAVLAGSRRPGLTVTQPGPAYSSGAHLAVRRCPSMTTRHHRPIAVLAAAALAALALSACARNEPSGAPGNDPVKAVKEFLINGTVDQDGYEACVFLATREQGAAARRVGGSECRQAFDLARLRLGGKRVDTVHEVDHLAASAAVDGGRASVRLTSGGQSIRFELVRATSAERAQFLAPDTEWRIAAGALPLIPKQEA